MLFAQGTAKRQHQQQQRHQQHKKYQHTSKNVINFAQGRIKLLSYTKPALDRCNSNWITKKKTMEERETERKKNCQQK